jgi:N-formylglutamate amidohydrolase
VPCDDVRWRPLYRTGTSVPPEAVAGRRRDYFEPYHRLLCSELHRLRARYERIVLFEAHSIRSRVPRLFEGELPHLNLGTNSVAAVRPSWLSDWPGCVPLVSRTCRRPLQGRVTTRHYGQPDNGVHAVQLEIACRAYLDEPAQHIDGGKLAPAIRWNSRCTTAADARTTAADLRRILHALRPRRAPMLRDVGCVSPREVGAAILPGRPRCARLITQADTQ